MENDVIRADATRALNIRLIKKDDDVYVLSAILHFQRFLIFWLISAIILHLPILFCYLHAPEYI